MRRGRLHSWGAILLVRIRAVKCARLGLVLAGRYHAAMPRCLPVAVAVVLILALAPAAAVGANTNPGPITARVVSVYIAMNLEVIWEMSVRGL